MEFATRCLLLLASLGAAEPGFYDKAMMSSPEPIDYKDPCKAGEKKPRRLFTLPAVLSFFLFFSFLSFLSHPFFFFFFFFFFFSFFFFSFFSFTPLVYTSHLL
ncbi:hypothetical protein QTP70_001213 [Hemibagrus guttatus]|uniref:Uncharacterized protein n=1 Tax=Hemibagrus guttatus TaxID=175788 RepID=A0AAE0R1T7_9TELE|nr:hypothetical protein QTP70_001213 [Hemibagrus guttatus]